MPAYKEPKTGKWYCQFYVKNRDGSLKKKMKRGFALKRDAEQWEREYIAHFKESPNMPFSALAEAYLKDKKETRKPVTYRTSESRVRVWIVPYFGNTPINEITPLDVKKWQSYLRESKTEHSKPLSTGYIGTLHRELSIIMNYAVKYYGLPNNPAAIAGNVKNAKVKSLQFWTLEQFNAFISTFSPAESFRTAFLTLYWTGCRVGELQALKMADIDLLGQVINIDKTFHIVHGQHITHEPKTAASIRTVSINQSLADELKSYIERIYDPDPEDRLFPMTPSSYGKQLKAHAEMAGLPPIRVHDLRHSHASLLIELGYSPTLIAARLGHENVSMTLNIYGHLYPNKSKELADSLEKYFLESK